MDPNDLQKRLIYLARKNPPSEKVPYSFERRVMAAIGSGAQRMDPLAFWNKHLWQAAAPCVAVTVAICLWSWFQPGVTSDMTPDLETTLIAPLDTPGESW